MANHAEVRWKRKTYLGYFDRASGFAGVVSMLSLGVGGNLDATGMEKALSRIDKQSMYSGVTLKDPFLRGMLGLFSEELWVSLGLIPLSGVY